MNESESQPASPGNQNPRLSIELVPITSWCQNVRSSVSSGEWDRIRKQVYKNANYCCEICGGRGKRWPVECHEKWVYDDDNYIQELAGFIALCPRCHKVKHIGNTINLGLGMMALAHLQRVNGWDKETASYYIQQSFALWHERSQHEWSVNVFSINELT